MCHEALDLLRGLWDGKHYLDTVDIETSGRGGRRMTVSKEDLDEGEYAKAYDPLSILG